jgi:hypothetical protein
MTEPERAIVPKLMIEPTHWLEIGIRLETIGGLQLFKFTESLQTRSDNLLDLSKSRDLSPEEQAELESLTQLSQVFTYANSLLAANTLWFQPHSENLSPNEPPRVVNTAIPQSS